MKKRILLVNEASYLSTGFSVYGYEILNRLHATQKYELAEFAAYGEASDERAGSIPWKFYANMPDAPEQHKAYNSKMSNHFGEWRFEQVCLDFKPDIVWDIRDVWMFEFECRSPFRPFFKWVIMPTVDSAPQEDNWISIYMQADAVFTYSEFGLSTLHKQSSGLMKLWGVASPGANLTDFQIVPDKKQLREDIGVPSDILIVGTVMRNQERKLYPDLMQAFRLFLDTAPSHIAKKAYLYLHTCYPDVGWRLPVFLKEFGLINRTLFTYVCRNCGAVFPSLYQDARTFCKKCKQYTAILPGVKSGISRQALNQVLNLFDAYVQYSVCEGFGMPQVEAAAAGVPCLAVDYSAMHDIIKKLNGIPIEVERMFCDPRTHAYRALPDNKDFVNKLITILDMPIEERLAVGQYSREQVKKHYSWDKTAKIWEDCFDNIDILPPEQSWASPSRVSQPVTQYPKFGTNSDFIDWAIVNIAGRPELLNSYISMRMNRELNLGLAQNGPIGMDGQPTWMPYEVDAVINEMLKICDHKNAWEKFRLGVQSQ